MKIKSEAFRSIYLSRIKFPDAVTAPRLFSYSEELVTNSVR